MKTYSIDAENNITVHGSRKAARETGADVFASGEQFADLIGPDNKRLVEIWNSLAGVKPVTKFANRKSATERIWKALQSLEHPATLDPAVTETEAIPADSVVAERPNAQAGTEVPPENMEPESVRPLADVTLEAEIESVVPSPTEAGELVQQDVPRNAQAPQEAAEASVAENAAPAKKTRKAKKVANGEVSTGPREGSKTARVVAMLQRENGATIDEIMLQMGWQKHTVRGFMAGAMKKAGYTVESFKSENGERSYRINR